MPTQKKLAHKAGWNDTVHGINTADSTKVMEYVLNLRQIVQVAISKKMATFYHYGVQDATDDFLAGKKLDKVA